MDGAKAQYAPGEKVDLTLSVTNEKGEPVPAALGVAVVDEALAGSAGDRTPAMPTCFLLTSELEQPGRAWQTPTSISPTKPRARCRRRWPWTCCWARRRCRPAADQRRPSMFDNLAQIRSNYEKSLADYQADRTKTLNTLTTASFFGGLGLVLLVAMLGLMRIVSGMHLWVAAIGATTCCLIIGAILMDPGRLATGQDVAVGVFLVLGADRRNRNMPRESPIVAAERSPTSTSRRPEPTSSNSVVQRLRSGIRC